MTEQNNPQYPPAEVEPATQATAADAATPASKTSLDDVIAALNAVADKINTAASAPETATAVEAVKPVLSKNAKIRGVLYEIQKGIGAVVAIAPAVLVFLNGDVKDLAVSAVGIITAAGAYLAKANLSD